MKILESPDSPGLINNAAYTYANMRYKFSKAFALMDKYVALMPKDANPQDSYGGDSAHGRALHRRHRSLSSCA